MWSDTGKDFPVGVTVGLRGWCAQGELGGGGAPSFGPKFGKGWGGCRRQTSLSPLLKPRQ